MARRCGIMAYKRGIGIEHHHLLPLNLYLWNSGYLIKVFLIIYFWKPEFACDLCRRGLWTPILFISAILTAILSMTSAGFLKSRPDIDGSLSVLSCTLAAQTGRYDHTTVCQCQVRPPRLEALISQNAAFALTIILIIVDIFFIVSLWFSYSRHDSARGGRSSAFFSQSRRQSLQARFRDFQFEVRSLRAPSPIYRRPRTHPGRVWRLAWGDMEDSRATPTPGPGTAAGQWKRRSGSSVGPTSPVQSAGGVWIWGNFFNGCAKCNGHGHSDK